jgi:dolichol-phosphate mannosyltransferase
MRSTKPLFAVVVPMHNEQESVAALADEIAAACAPAGPFEAIFVDDGSTDATAARIADAQTRHPWLRAAAHPRACGQSAAVATGVRLAEAPVVCTIDGDGQNPPAEIPKLVAPLLDPARPPRLGLVCGVRVIRQDGKRKRASSAFANALRRWLLRDDAPDTGCGLKAFPRELFLRMPFFDHIHRFLPAIFRADGWAVIHLPVEHRPRGAGRTKYGTIDRALVGALDLIGVWWLVRRRRRSAPARSQPWSAAPAPVDHV